MITTSALRATAGQCAGPFTFETRNALNQSAPVQMSTLVNFSASPNTLTFFTDSSCMLSAGNSVNFTSVKSNHTVYVRGTTAGSPTITVSAPATTLTSASQVELLSAGPPVSLAFVGTTGPAQAMACVPMTLELRDTYSNLATFSAGGVVSLTTTPGTLRFHTDATCTGTGVGMLTFPINTSTLSFAVRPVTGVTQTLQAVVGGLSDTHTLTVDPAVRRGTCSMLPGQTSTTCTITPAQRDVSKTLLVFQAISPQANDPQSAEVRCRLSSTTQLSCVRGTGGVVDPAAIAWQTLELPTGLTVQRGESASCPTAPLPLVTPVNPLVSFTLSSVTGSGDNYDGDDMTSSRLSADGLSVSFEPFNGADPCTGYEYQVASMTGVGVLRGVTPGFSNGGAFARAQSVVGLSAPSANVVLVSQSNLSGTTPPNSASMCHFFTRGEMDSPTSLRFTRGATIASGCDNYATGNIVWQRIDFGTRATVQPFTLNIVGNQDQGTQTISTVDTTRTLVFSGGMMGGGLGTGETAYNNGGSDEIGDSLAAFSLTANAVTLNRGGTNATSIFTFYVVQFEP